MDYFWLEKIKVASMDKWGRSKVEFMWNLYKSYMGIYIKKYIKFCLCAVKIYNKYFQVWKISYA